VKVDDNKIIVPFELARLKKGDFAIMYNVYFFKDAGVMRPESRYEVTSLLEMLQENPKYKIRIHGHTNGNSAGKIISMSDSKNFFSLKDTKEGFGSAKKLSEERAKVIQSYLVSQGVDPARMQIKAWGGKRPVYEKDSQQAHANVRVEIEILED
jgi:outer membrane protein OmpA-like peptidoglycan-associated protein